MKGKVIFEEEQRVIGTRTWYLVIGLSITIVTGTLVLATYVSEPTSERYIGTIISTIVFGCVIAFISTMRLYVVIDEKSIYYRFPPFVNKEKHFSKKDIKEMKVRKYRPIWEYGGYGYRFSFRSGRAYNITGNMGLQLHLNNGKRVLIGTQKPDSMQTAISRLKENWEMNG